MYGYSIDYPENWDAFQGDLSLGEFLFVASGDLSVPRLLVDLSFASELGDVQAMAEQVLDPLRELIEGLELLSERPITLSGGADAYEYTLGFPSDTLPLRGKLLVVPRGAQLFQVFAQTVPADFEAREADLDRIVRSFRLIEPAPFGAPRSESLTLREPSPATLDPHSIGDIVSHQYASQIFSGLVTFDPGLQVAPDLAASWDVEEGGTVYVFHLREDAKFHSGKPVTAEDIKYSIERAAAPATGSLVTGIYLNDIVGFTERRAGLANEVAGVEVLDDFTVRIRITRPVPYFLSKLAHSSGFILNRENVESGGPAWFFQPDGTGPFKLKGWDPGVVLVLERNEEYYGPRAFVPSVIIWNIGGDPLVAYEAGDLDVASIGGETARAVQDPSHPLQGELGVTPELGVLYLGFNAQLAPFDDPRARRAFALAIDRDTIIADIRSGTVQKANGFVPLGMANYAPPEPLAFDAQQARALWDEVLAETGQEIDSIVFQLAGISLLPYHQAVAEMWQETFGVEVEFQGSLGGDRAEAVAEGGAHVFEFGWIADYPDPHNFLDVLFHSQAITNIGRYSNAELDGLLEAARVEQDPAERSQTYRQADELLLQDAAAVPLWYFRSYVLVKPYVEGWFLNSLRVTDYSAVSLERSLPRQV